MVKDVIAPENLSGASDKSEQEQATDSSIKQPKQDTQSRKYLFTINDPAPKGFTHDKIKDVLMSFKGIRYYCMADEQGSCYHTHVYAVFSSPVRFSTVQKRFEFLAHIETAYGSSEANRAYLLKEGEKWENSGKQETKIEGSFFEWGTMPQEHQGARNDLSFLYEMVKEGYSNYEILENNPDFMLRLTDIERARQTIKSEENRTMFRTLETTYIYGDTATGKTRYVMEKYGYENTYRVTDYKHPFDSYKNEDIVVFDEFSSHLRIQDMNNYLDGYPLDLPCRYANRQACYTKVYIISNIDLKQQYTGVQFNDFAIWQAFLRRIHRVIKFDSHGRRIEYTIKDYLNGFIGEVIENVHIDDTPFGKGV